MDTTIISAKMPEWVRGRLPYSSARFRYCVFDGRPKVSVRGRFIDPEPLEGEVILVNVHAVVVETGQARFAVLDPALVTHVPAQGERVRVEPYARRRFDGCRVDAPVEQVVIGANGRSRRMKLHIPGFASARLPVPELSSSELMAMACHLQELRMPEGYRHIEHLLADARARDFEWNAPGWKPASLEFTVETEKFQGRVRLFYTRAFEQYVIDLLRGEQIILHVEHVHLTALGETLEYLIGDGAWRRIRVQVLS